MSEPEEIEFSSHAKNGHCYAMESGRNVDLTNGFPAPDFKSNLYLLQTGNMGYKSIEREEISGESTLVCKL